MILLLTKFKMGENNGIYILSMETHSNLFLLLLFFNYIMGYPTNLPVVTLCVIIVDTFRVVAARASQKCCNLFLIDYQQLLNVFNFLRCRM